MKVLIAYHDHCIDGYTSAWTCWRGLLSTTSILNENITLLPVSYAASRKILDAAEGYDTLYIVDFSLDPGAMNELLAAYPNLTTVTVDHHISAMQKFEKAPVFNTRATFYFDVNECGASLVWKYFYGEDSILPKLIEYVKDYDLWKFEMSESRGVNKYLRLQDKNLNNWQRLEDKFNSSHALSSIITTGGLLQTYHMSIVYELVEQAEQCTINGKLGLAVNCSPQFSSDVGHALALISGTFGATWQQEKGGQYKWSLRSNGNYDVSKIAEGSGGGGHKNAAGFYLSMDGME